MTGDCGESSSQLPFPSSSSSCSASTSENVRVTDTVDSEGEVVNKKRGGLFSSESRDPINDTRYYCIPYTLIKLSNGLQSLDRPLYYYVVEKALSILLLYLSIFTITPLTTLLAFFFVLPFVADN